MALIHLKMFSLRSPLNCLRHSWDHPSNQPWLDGWIIETRSIQSWNLLCFSYFSNTAELIISTQPHYVLNMSILFISFSSIAIAPKAVLGAIEQQQMISELDENEKAIFGLKRWDWTIDEKQVLSYGLLRLCHVYFLYCTCDAI